MYAPQYGFGPGNPSASVPFNPNGMPQQRPPQQLGLQPQHMMYNPQQYGSSAGPQLSPYAVSGPGMGGNAGGMGMMQNNGMAHMGGGEHAVPPYQTPYSSSPYGGLPASTAANLPPNFMPASSNPPPMSMNINTTNMMNPQYQAQRMQPPPPSLTPTQSLPRTSPLQGMPHNASPNTGSAQSQFAPPQHANQQQTHQIQNSNQQQHPQTIVTPQTPNFPPGSQGSGNLSTPLSPGSEVRERERVSVLLEINRELLRECLRLQTQNREEAKEATSAATSPSDGPPKEKAEKEKAEKDKLEKAKGPASRDYVECMRRLQGNLAYLAAIADRSHKPSSQIPAHPAYMSAPPLTPLKSPQPSSTATSPKAESKKEDSDEKKAEEQEGDRIAIIKGFYKKLQDLFPGVDPKKEPPMQPSNAARQQQAAVQQGHMQASQGPHNQGHNQGQGGQVDISAQQKLQTDLLRQKIMQAQQIQQTKSQVQPQAQGQAQQSQGMGAQQTQNR